MLLYQTGEEEKAARLWPKWKQGGRQIPNLRGGATSHWQVAAKFLDVYENISSTYADHRLLPVSDFHSLGVS